MYNTVHLSILYISAFQSNIKLEVEIRTTNDEKTVCYVTLINTTIKLDLIFIFKYNLEFSFVRSLQCS
jgi:hypothetical protein